MSEPTKLGYHPFADAGRDAVHVAIIPMRAIRRMMPGERLQNGVVDPFLTAPVEPRELFLLCLYPGTITNLRHVWSHPSFVEEKA